MKGYFAFGIAAICSFSLPSICSGSMWLESFTSVPVQRLGEKHFEVEYSENNKDLVKPVLSAANSALNSLSTSLSLHIPQKAQIFIMPDEAAYYSLHNEAKSCGKVDCASLAVVLNPSCLRNLSKDLLYDVVVHELAHIYICSYCEGTIPMWLNEGFACYFGNTYFKFAGKNTLLQADPLIEMVDPLKNPYSNYPKSLSVFSYILEKDYSGDISLFFKSISGESGRELIELYSDPLNLGLIDSQWRNNVNKPEQVLMPSESLWTSPKIKQPPAPVPMPVPVAN